VNLTERALLWVHQGYSVMPLNGKVPVMRSWKHLRDELPTEGDVVRWCENWPSVGLLASRGLVFVDFDRLGLWSEAQAMTYGLTGLELDRFYHVRTRRGVHLYVKTAEQVASRHIIGQVDIITKTYVVMSGSRVEDFEYRAADERAPILELADFETFVRPWLPVGAVGAESVFYTRPTLPIVPLQPVPTTTDNVNLSVWERAKSVPICDVLGVQLVTQGERYGMARCPLHDDRTPSLSVDLWTNRVSCLAGCTGRHGWDSVDAAAWRFGEPNLYKAALKLVNR